MELFEKIMLAACVAMLTGALALAITRLVIGPNSLDRVVSLDTIVAVAQCVVAVFIGFSLDSTTAPVIVVLALIAFLGSVSVGRFRVPDSDVVPGQSGKAEAGWARIETAAQDPHMPWPKVRRKGGEQKR